MNKSMITGTLLGVVAATAIGTMAGYQYINQGPEFAEVLSVKAVTETYSVPRETCFDQVVTHKKPVKDQNQVTGTVIGAVVGGLLGHQVGGGSGKKIATIAGVAAGGYAGNKAQEELQNRDTYTTTERICNTEHDKRQKTLGYDVEYRLDGSVNVVRMDYKPGPQIPVKEGKLVLEPSNTSNY